MAQAQTTSPAERARGSAATAQPAPASRPVDSERVPGLAVTTDPRWALGFLARIYTKAQERKVLNTLSGWIEPDSRSLRTVFNPARNASFAHRTTRDLIVGAVVTDLIAAGELPATTSKNTKDLRILFERETVLGTSLIEGLAANWMSARLAEQRQKVLRLLTEANGMPALMAEAARQVVARVAQTSASIREDDLYRVMYPKHRRAWRDGSTMDRVDHLRYIAAVRDCARAVQTHGIISRDPPADPGAETRGLTRAPRETPTVAPEPSQTPTARKTLADAFKALELIAWHPQAVALMQAWKAGPQTGIKRQAEVVNESVVAIDQLAAKLQGDRAIVWRFPAALRGSIAALNVVEKDPLTHYALIWASAVKPALDVALEVLGNVITLLELYGGPLAPVAAVADAIVQAAGAAVSILRELDQDHAESATLFEKEADRLSTGGRIGGALAQGASALVAATAVPGALRKLAGAIRKEKALAPKPSAVAGGAEPGTGLADRSRRGTGDRRSPRPASGEIPKTNPIATGAPTEPTTWTAGRRSERPPSDARAVEKAQAPSPESNVGGATPSGKRVGAPVASSREPFEQLTDTLNKRFPKLEAAKLKPVRRRYGQPLFYERMWTNQHDFSLEGMLPDGTKIQLDDISPDGLVVEIKIRTAERPRDPGIDVFDRGTARYEEIVPVDTFIKDKRALERGSKAFDDDIEEQLIKQWEFAKQYGLRGVAWRTNDAKFAATVERVIADLRKHDIRGLSVELID